MKSFFTIKTRYMKPINQVMSAVFSRRTIAVMIAVVVLTWLNISPANAQGNKWGKEKNQSNRQQGNWRNEKGNRNDQMRKAERRNDVSVDRSNSSGDYKRNRKSGNENRNFRQERNNNSSSINRNQDRNNNTVYNNRNNNRNIYGNSNRSGNNNNNSNFRRHGNSNRHIYTHDRPGHRPVYRYNWRPVYNAYNPSWRYNYLPRRNSYYYGLPSAYFSISFGGFSYRYWDGVFYRPYNNLFTVCAPPVGIFINVLPVGYRTIYVRNYPYYYYNGAYYDQRGANYYVVSPPVGAVVESLPDGYETVVIDGETYYTVDDAQYKPVVMDNGEIWYEVIKAN